MSGVWKACWVMAWALSLAVVSWSGPRMARADDAVLDAKRKAAGQLMKEGKAGEAIALLHEVLLVDAGNWRDHLQMARAMEKQGQAEAAIKEYRETLRLMAPSPRDGEERSGRQEAEKRLKAMDPTGEKISAAVEEFEKKLDALEREAMAARSMMSMGEIFRLRGRLWQARGLKGRGYAEVTASGAWQDSGMDVQANHTYRVRAAGTWRVQGANDKAYVECTADGTTVRPYLDNRKVGQLLAEVGGNYYPLGTNATFTPKSSGRLQLIEDDTGQAARLKNTGALQVLIVQEN